MKYKSGLFILPEEKERRNMLICGNGHVFNKPISIRYETGVVSEGFHETYEEDVCPVCHNDDLSEAYTCKICGEWSREPFCPECIKQMKSELMEVVRQFSNDMDSNIQLANIAIDDLTDEGEL